MHDGWLARVGNLRTGYLAAFAKLAYEYALHPRLALVRQQLRVPETQSLLGFWADFDGDAPERRTGWEMAFFRQPAPCILVRIKRRGILLPWVTGPAWEYPYPADESRDEKRVTLRRGTPLLWPKTMEMELDFAEQVGSYRLHPRAADDDETGPPAA